MIKAIFFDNDGTILSHELKAVPSSTYYALQKLKEQGIKIIMATGRSLQELQSLAGNDILYDAYLLNNGQVCMDEHHQVLFSYPIKEKDHELLVTLFHEQKFPLVFVEEDRIYTNMINDYIIKALADVSTQVPPIGKYDGKKLIQAVAYLNKQQASEIKDLLTESQMTKWHEYGFDIYSVNGGKLAAMKHYMALYDLKDDEVMAFGDGENDIEMLKHAYIGVAMGNASEEVKAISDYITTDINQDGILNALKHFKIIQ